jgi:pimeloyl-ACP methyl ester carboxylesterase
MTMLHHRLIKTDGVEQNVLEDGEGPLVILCHGFPELSISWRAQVEALAAAGYHAVAPDMRGYGKTEKVAAAHHTILHLVSDMVDLVRALGETQAVIVGHDWGAPVAWHCALLRPDVFKAVAGLSVPFQARNPTAPPLQMIRAYTKAAGTGDLYIERFQDNEALAEFSENTAVALRKSFYAYDGATPAEKRATGFVPDGKTLLQTISINATLPPWMSERQFGEYVRAFERGGFARPFGWYRSLDRNWQLTSFAQGKKIDVPAMFMVGEVDPVRNYVGSAEAGLPEWCTDLRAQTVLKGAGHWLQQERPDEVNAALLDFLSGL